MWQMEIKKKNTKYLRIFVTTKEKKSMQVPNRLVEFCPLFDSLSHCYFAILRDIPNKILSLESYNVSIMRDFKIS